MPPQYPIRAVSKITGIAVDTLRAWERRYQAVTPNRGDRGRVYSDADVQRLLLIQGALDRGHAIGQVAALQNAELQNLLRDPLAPSRSSRSNTSQNAVPRELDSLMAAIESFDYGQINEELNRLALLLSPAGLVYEVVLPVMKLAGENWENGTFPIAQEHMFSACVRSLLGSLVRLQRPANGAPRLLFTTPAHEMHEFGILSAALLAVAQDFPVAYLGPSLPARETLLAAAGCDPQAVVLGIMQTNVTPAMCADLQQIASELPEDIELWMGGSGAVNAANGIARRGTVLLESLPDFEQHLSRLKRIQARQGAL
jgi:DNA-binding transcriptional MerR regulator